MWFIVANLKPLITFALSTIKSHLPRWDANGNKMSVLNQHSEAVKAQNYHALVTKFEGYIQFNSIYDSKHNEIAFTASRVRRCVEIISHPDYAYSRQKDGYINIYIRSAKSPTGVELLGGIPNDLDFLLAALGRTGQLSPTEDLRTAH